MGCLQLLIFTNFTFCTILKPANHHINDFLKLLQFKLHCNCNCKKYVFLVFKRSLPDCRLRPITVLGKNYSQILLLLKCSAHRLFCHSTMDCINNHHLTTWWPYCTTYFWYYWFSLIYPLSTHQLTQCMLIYLCINLVVTWVSTYTLFCS